MLRSVYTLVLGLGGWFGGVIVALVAFPSLPLDDVLLAVVSIGVPIGLGIYLAWVDRSRPGRFRPDRLHWPARSSVPGSATRPAPGSSP